MKRLSLALLLLTTAAHAEQPISNSAYFCETLFAGGLAYNQNLKRWNSTTFQVDKKFVLRLKFARSKMEKDAAEKDVVAYYYKMTLTPAGKSDPSPCVDYNKIEDDWMVPIGNGLHFFCSVDLINYTFNLKANRFLATYLYGYVNGKDNNDDTPNVAGGTCTKID